MSQNQLKFKKGGERLTKILKVDLRRKERIKRKPPILNQIMTSEIFSRRSLKKKIR